MTRSRRLLVLSAAALSTVATVATIASASAAPPRTSPVAAVAATTVHRTTTPFPGKSARTIRNLSVASLRKAKTFRVAGTEGKEKINIFVSAGSAYGDITDARGTTHVVRVGTSIYFVLDAGTLAKEGLPASLANRWLKLPATDPAYKDVLKLVTPAAWASWLGRQPVSFRRTGVKVTGSPTVQLWQPGKKGGSLYVATTGPAYPRWIYRNDKAFNYLFVDFNRPFHVTAPAPSQVIVVSTKH